jgi:PBSX family phage terminase large subunit
MVAKSLTTLKRNCLILLQELVGGNFTYSISTKEGKLFGRKIILEGANDIRSESKIRGVTLQGAYCDELTQFPEDFFAMLLSRLRLPGAKLIATTNPDSPSHWLKARYIDRKDELDFLDVQFLLDDNTTLPQDYVENIKREYTGVFYERFILGKWTLAEGIIYTEYSQAIETPPEGKPTRYVLSIDYGTQNPFSAGLWALYGDIWYRVREYYYGGRDKGIQKTDAEYLEDLNRAFGDIDGQITTIIDPSAASFIALLRQSKRYKVRKADNAVLDGIRETATAMHKGMIKISPECKDWIREAQGYVWDDSGVEDRPVKENDHAMDETRYFVKTMRITKQKNDYVPLNQRRVV